MRKAIALALGVLVSTFTAGSSTSLAALSATWQQNPITAAAIADDPALAGMQSWSLRSTSDVGNWAAAEMVATLSAGTFYSNPFGLNVTPDPVLVAQHPALQFDTYVTDPTRTDVLVLGGASLSYPQLSFGGPLDAIPGQFSVAWGDLITDAPGSYEIARLTFPLGSFPSVFQGPPAGDRSLTFIVNPDDNAPIPQIPEPMSLWLLCGAVSLLLRRRHPCILAS